MRCGFRVLAGALMLGAWCAEACGGATRQSDGSGGAAPGDEPFAGLPIDHAEVAYCQQSASTNAPSVTVTVYDDGSAERVSGPPKLQPGAPPKSYPAGSPEVLTFLADVQAVGDVSLIPIGLCAKSISLGTATIVMAYGRTSGDLQCASTPTPAQAQLIEDCDVLLGNSL